MTPKLLLDTGPFVACINPSEKQHAQCVAFLRAWRGPILTTEAVLTETLYLVGARWAWQQTCLKFFLRGAFTLVPQTPSTLERIMALMEKYKDVPMDFADATLVALGEELERNQIFTLDRRDFAIYRLNGKKPFQIFP